MVVLHSVHFSLVYVQLFRLDSSAFLQSNTLDSLDCYTMLPTQFAYQGPDHEKKIDRTLKGLFQSSADYQAAFLSILLDAYQVYKKQGHTVPKSVSAAVGEWVVSETGLRGLLDMAYDSVMDQRTQRPSTSCWLTFDELRQDLLVKGVGPKNLKLGFSDAKLGKELEVLGYCKAIKNAKTCKGKKTSVAVRCGLRKKDPDDVGPLLTVTEDDGAEDKAAGDKRTNQQRDTKGGAL